MDYKIARNGEAWVGSDRRDDADGEPLLVTASQIATLMQISTRTLWRLLSGGKIPEPLRIGGAVRWRLDDVKSWIAAGCPVPKASSTQKGR
jgi:excisionase family DNA binding protein